MLFIQLTSFTFLLRLFSWLEWWSLLLLPRKRRTENWFWPGLVHEESGCFTKIRFYQFRREYPSRLNIRLGTRCTMPFSICETCTTYSLSRSPYRFVQLMTMTSFNRIKIWSVLVFLHYKKHPRHMIESIPLKTLDRGEQARSSQPPAAASPPPSPPCPPCRPELAAPQTASPPDLVFQQTITTKKI